MLVLTISFDRFHNEETLNHCLGLGGYCGMQKYSSIRNEAIITLQDSEVDSEMGFIAIIMRELHKFGYEFTLKSEFEA